MSAAPERDRPSARGEIGRPVVVHDAGFVRWEVTERSGESVPGARGPRCLVFMSDGAVRRIWEYPPHWRRLAPDALLALSERP